MATRVWRMGKWAAFALAGLMVVGSAIWLGASTPTEPNPVTSTNRKSRSVSDIPTPLDREAERKKLTER